MAKDDRQKYEVLSPVRCDGELHMPAKDKGGVGDLVPLDPDEAEHLIDRGIVRVPAKGSDKKAAAT